MEVKYAVIPCAGHGTRFLPITKGVPKEMCPIVDRPTLDYIVEECLDAGITDIVLIVSEGKDDIKKYYDVDSKYEEELKRNGKEEYATLIHKIATKAKFHYVTQHELLGLGHAVLQAKDVVGRNNFVVCCGDDICTYVGKSPVTQLVESFLKNGGYTVVGGQTVEHKNIVKYGSMDVKSNVSSRTYELKGIVEKPKLDEAPSDLASLGKRVFNYKIFEELENTPKGAGGEIQLTDAIARLLTKEPVYFYDFVGKRYDCGDKLGYLTAIIDIALTREEFKEGLLNHIKKIIK